jgi:hypothetical protein
MINTFIPFANIKKCAKVLDQKRLLKQRIEAYQIINIIQKRKNGEKCGFMNHPAVIMWENNVNALKLYCNEMIKESINRGFNNTMKLYDIKDKIVYPWWWGYSHIHYSHQASLLRKNPDYYIKYFYDLLDEYRYEGYVWITHRKEKDIVKIKEHLKGKTKNPFTIEQISYKITIPRNIKNQYYTVKKDGFIYYYPTYRNDQLNKLVLF